MFDIALLILFQSMLIVNKTCATVSEQNIAFYVYRDLTAILVDRPKSFAYSFFFPTQGFFWGKLDPAVQRELI